MLVVLPLRQGLLVFAIATALLQAGCISIHDWR
jgi:hypothetical protein